MAFAAARGAVDPPSDDAELEARATEDSSMAVRCPPAGGARRIARKAEGGGGVEKFPRGSWAVRARLVGYRAGCVLMYI